MSLLRVRPQMEIIHEFKPIVSPYFGEIGITSTHANTIANRLKHLYESVENELNSINFVQTKFGLIGTPEENYSIAKEAKTDCNIEDLISRLELITECKSFIAFLREAIKAKETLASEIDHYMSEELEALKSPKCEAAITEEDILAEMSVKDREHYLSLETRAAVYGKFIHPDNAFDKAIKDIEKAIANPRHVEYNGANTIIELQQSTVSLDTINSVYMGLQNEHRKSESELNGIKHSIEERIKEDTKKKTEAWTNALKQYDSERQQLINKDAGVRDSRRKEIQALKIVIPKRFEELYNCVK